MRRAAKIDANQPEISDRFLRHGYKVQSLAGVGCGFPDLIVWRADQGYKLIEVKDGSRIPSERKLTDDQRKFHKAWAPAPIEIVETVEDVDRIAGAGC